MNRRTYLKSLVGSRQSNQEMAALIAPMDAYAGEWTTIQASHLLRRTTFASNRDTIEEVVDNGLAFTLDQLFAPRALPAPPINYFFTEDPYVPVGQTWVHKLSGDGINGYRNRSLRAWTFNLMIDEGIHIREKLTLFWHNHLVTEGLNNANLKYDYITLLREMAFGNFKTIIEAITLNPTMLIYLNGTDNKVGSPNENYSRELLELFAIGKGDLAGAGDYTFFTEQDVEEMAKALTGWQVREDEGDDNEIAYPYYNDNRHDKTTKQLSHRFGNATISNNGANEYLDVINIIFQQDETARYICRKLYRYFLQETILPSTEMQVIEPMADLLRQNNYELEPVLRAFFSSDHFYDVACIGTMIKNPIEQVVGLITGTKTTIPTEDATKYEFGNYFHGRAKLMQMEYFAPPNVAGWKAYYQEPSFYRIWISTVTLPQRMDYIDDLVLRRVTKNEVELKINPMEFVDQIPIDISTDPNLLIEDLASSFFSHPLDEAQLIGLKEILIPGLPDFEWTVEYGNYLNPGSTSEELKIAVENKLKNLFRTMFTMPEYFVC